MLVWISCNDAQRTYTSDWHLYKLIMATFVQYMKEGLVITACMLCVMSSYTLMHYCNRYITPVNAQCVCTIVSTRTGFIQSEIVMGDFQFRAKFNGGMCIWKLNSSCINFV